MTPHSAPTPGCWSTHSLSQPRLCPLWQVPHFSGSSSGPGLASCHRNELEQVPQGPAGPQQAVGALDLLLLCYEEKGPRVECRPSFILNLPCKLGLDLPCPGKRAWQRAPRPSGPACLDLLQDPSAPRKSRTSPSSGVMRLPVGTGSEGDIPGGDVGLSPVRVLLPLWPGLDAWSPCTGPYRWEKRVLWDLCPQ